MLTGLIPPTSGDAFIYDLSVASEQDKIRRVLGVCPQHDILWPELTAAQHLEIFAQFKAVPSAMVDVLIRDKLNEVELSHVANQKVHTFSGGMKRRLSVAISSIGEPLMIFFDEPVLEQLLAPLFLIISFFVRPPVSTPSADGAYGNSLRT
jgi:ABC-type multidrug transport system ATPase subunit